MKKAAILLGLFALSGCASPQTETVYLAQGDKRAQCGPYFRGIGSPYTMGVAEQNLRACVNDYQSQGYTRTAGP